MVERLKQIWGGFEGVTTRKLTGRGIDNIAVPHRQDWQAEDQDFLPDQFSAPSAVAFEALKARLAAKEKKHAKKPRHRADAADMAPPLAEPSENGEMEGAKNMIRGLMATEARIARADYDYADYLDAVGGRKKGLFARVRKPKVAAGPRKKIFGLF